MPLINKEPKRMGNIVVTEFVDSVGTDEVTFTFPNSTEQDTFQLYNISPKELVVTVGAQVQNVPAYQVVKISEAYSSFKIKALSGVGGFRATCSYEDSDEEDEVILGDRINQLTTQLAQKATQTDLTNTNANVNLKADKTYTDSQLALKRDKAALLTMNDLGQDVKTAMTGGSVAVVGENVVNSSNLINGAVIASKTTFLKKTNLFNKKTMTDKAIIGSNMNTLITSGYDGFAVSNIIRAVPNTKYTFSALANTADQRVGTFDSGGVMISNITPTANGDGTYSITTPANAYYIRFNLNKLSTNSFVDTFMVIEGANTDLPTQYVPYGIQFNDTFVQIDSIQSSVDKFNGFFTKNTNLFNKNDIVNGYFLSGSTMDTFTANSIFAISNIIKGKGNTKYTYNAVANSADNRIACFDVNRTQISNLVPTNNGNGTYTVTTPANAVYIRFNMRIPSTYIDTFMFIEGQSTDMPAQYTPYGVYTQDSFPELQGLIGQRFLFLGDSITWQGQGAGINGWHKYFNEVLKPIITKNDALFGATLTDYSDTLQDDVVYDSGTGTYSLNSILRGDTSNTHNNTMSTQIKRTKYNKYTNVSGYENFDAIFLAFSTNDGAPESESAIESQFVSNNTIVDISTVDKKTFSGALRWAYEQLMSVYPNARIFVCTPIQSNHQIHTYSSCKDKRDRLISICNRMSIPHIDSFNCGINGIYEVNGANGLDLNDGLHPNTNGAKKLGYFNANEFKRKYYKIP